MSCVLAEGLFDLDSVDFQQEDSCRCVPMQSQVIVDLMGITITCVDQDVIVLPLESGGNNLHVLLVAERELQRDLTLQLFANSILSDSAVVMMGLAAFRQHAAAYVDMTRAQVQVSLT